MRMQYRGSDLKVSTKVTDAFWVYSITIFFWGIQSLTQFFDDHSFRSLISALLSLIATIFFAIYLVKLIKIRDYLIERKIQDLDGKEN